MYYELTDSVRLIPGVGPKIFEELERMGIHTFADIIGWYPRRYIDGSHPTLIAEAPMGMAIAIRVKILSTKLGGAPGRAHFFDARCEDSSGEIILRWFNQPYLQKKLEVGTEWVCIGSIEEFRGNRQMVNPRVVEEPEIIPLYSQTKTVTSNALRGFVKFALEHVDLKGRLPEDIVQAEDLPPYAEAMHGIHRPQQMGEVIEASRYVAFSETFEFFIGILQGKGVEERQAGIPIPLDVEWMKKVVATLPFELTAGQKRVVWDALQEMASGTVMTRLVNGDVGSGKTVIAALLSALVARSGYRTVLLVPTEILAKQHANSIAQLLKTAGVRVALYTAAQKDDISSADLIIGTHAVLQQGFSVDKLGLVVIDEQHRFGVRQRALLRELQEQSPHFLSMTATPIPRTLALVLFADLTVSVLREKPKDRLPVQTEIVYPNARVRVHQRVLMEIQCGRQVFVLCPLIEEKEEGDELVLFSAEQEKKTVIKEAERLRTEHPEYGVIEVIHGKLKAAEKRAVMEKMAAGEINVLVATSVIEVGVDVPNATVMVVENAERFGLAQLHQLRGRVGRGKDQSYCLLCPSHPGGPAIERLQVLVDHESGFEVAEQDLALRGPGDVVGLVQSGLPSFRMARLTDLDFLQHVKEVAESYVKEHPDFLAQWASVDYSQTKASLE